MTDPNTRPAPEPLQFDRAIESGAPAGEQSRPALTCAGCGQPIETYYYHLGGATLCANCKQSVEQTLAKQHAGDVFPRAAIFGLGAAVAGAAIYYGVIALLNLEIGIVAILIGYMVGAAIRKGARGGGGRRYQILAVALTYFSVGLAYSPLVFKGLAAGHGGVSVVALGATFLLIFVLPVMAVIGSGASGILSVIIIGVGLRQAWRMTAGHTVTITGPYKVGGSALSPTT